MNNISVHEPIINWFYCCKNVNVFKSLINVLISTVIVKYLYTISLYKVMITKNIAVLNLRTTLFLTCFSFIYVFIVIYCIILLILGLTSTDDIPWSQIV